MRRGYDLSEKLPDGSHRWHCQVRGQFQALRKIHELVEHSPNEIVALDSITRELFSSSNNGTSSTRDGDHHNQESLNGDKSQTVSKLRQFLADLRQETYADGDFRAELNKLLKSVAPGEEPMDHDRGESGVDCT